MFYYKRACLDIEARRKLQLLSCLHLSLQLNSIKYLTVATWLYSIKYLTVVTWLSQKRGERRES